MRKLLSLGLVWGAGACVAVDTIPLEVPADPAAEDLAALMRAIAVSRADHTQEPFAARIGMAMPLDSNENGGGEACPAGMKLVAGEYCTQVEHDCLRHWYDESNKKKVCEEFAHTARCVGKLIEKRYCMDTYEWPNEKGVRPEVMNNFYQAQVKCAAVGKRMCTESEWTMACEGPERKPFPYGYERDARKCNGDHRWDDPDMDKVADRDAKELARLWRGVPSGSQDACVSDYGVADLPANLDEVVAAEASTTDFSSVNTGGPWYKGVRNQCRPKIYSHDEGFYYYYLGFRCCAEPDGQTSEPRTPKQIEEKMGFGNVERLARFTVEEMKEKLELKKHGQCDCGPKQTLCKTMCGTLLGPGAHDGDDSTRMAPGKP